MPSPYLDTSAVLRSIREIARALDAVHLATFVTARRRIADLEMLTVDERLRTAAVAS
jgi:hypothetical protein